MKKLTYTFIVLAFSSVALFAQQSTEKEMIQKR